MPPLHDPDVWLFDLDNTLLNGDSDFAWAQFLIAKGVLDREVQESRNVQFYEQYKAGTLDIFEFLDFQLAPLARHPRAQLDAWHREFMETSIRPMITARSRALVDEHLARGALVKTDDLVAALRNGTATVALDAGASLSLSAPAGIGVGAPVLISVRPEQLALSSVPGPDAWKIVPGLSLPIGAQLVHEARTADGAVLEAEPGTSICMALKDGGVEIEQTGIQHRIQRHAGIQRQRVGNGIAQQNTILPLRQPQPLWEQGETAVEHVRVFLMVLMDLVAQQHDAIHIRRIGRWHHGPRLARRRIKAGETARAIFKRAVDIVLETVHGVLRQKRA